MELTTEDSEARGRLRSSWPLPQDELRARSPLISSFLLFFWFFFFSFLFFFFFFFFFSFSRPSAHPFFSSSVLQLLSTYFFWFLRLLSAPHFNFFIFYISNLLFQFFIVCYQLFAVTRRCWHGGPSGRRARGCGQTPAGVAVMVLARFVSQNYGTCILMNMWWYWSCILTKFWFLFFFRFGFCISSSTPMLVTEWHHSPPSPTNIRGAASSFRTPAGGEGGARRRRRRRRPRSRQGAKRRSKDPQRRERRRRSLRRKAKLMGTRARGAFNLSNSPVIPPYPRS